MFSERTEESDEPRSYKKVRLVEIDDTTAQIATDEGMGEYTVYDVSGLELGSFADVKIHILSYDITYRTFYVEFKDPVTIRCDKKEGMTKLIVV